MSMAELLAQFRKLPLKPSSHMRSVRALDRMRSKRL
ncbi:Uncharacterised protein [Mycobacterium tuberculosis]|nr:Uncharacterised protein [Mycobacterium tuberculosis]